MSAPPLRRYKRKRRKKRSKVSKHQQKLARYAGSFLEARYYYEQTFDWLKSLDGKSPLFVDIYFPKYKLCIEYHGRQHFAYPNPFHKSKREFDLQRKRDKLKVKTLKEQGYTVIIWPYSVSISHKQVRKQLFNIKHPEDKHL